MKNAYLQCLALFGVGGAHPGGLSLTQKLLLKENLDRSSKVLDVGCGTGQTSAFISQKYQCHVTALDSSNLMLEKAKTRFLSLGLPVDIKHGYAESLPFHKGTFDLILSESVTAFTDMAKTVSEYKRVLKPGGVLLAIEMVQDGSMTEGQKKEILNFYGITQLQGEEQWCELFNEAGFSQIEVEKVRLHSSEFPEQYTNDYSLSNHIAPSFYKIFEQHHYYSMIYKNKLGCRVFRCTS
ncbi:class I SAM-dependent methyltransferase [Siminovitchia sediminis]|uniref:Class I SAM-dependent methyltransferase n=1 Tax=Siminovitchia sediminis TaxID=1274353 RepID=A0ABW4KFA6_9BACI